MDSFYVILPSNTPYPGNKTSDYLVKLPNIIDISDGRWTVALSSFVYPMSFSGIEEEQKITIYNADGTQIEIDIPKRLQYESIDHLEKALNNAISRENLEKQRTKRSADRPAVERRKPPSTSQMESRPQVVRRPASDQPSLESQISTQTTQRKQVERRPPSEKTPISPEQTTTQISQKPKVSQRPTAVQPTPTPSPEIPEISSQAPQIPRASPQPTQPTEPKTVMPEKAPRISISKQPAEEAFSPQVAQRPVVVPRPTVEHIPQIELSRDRIVEQAPLITDQVSTPIPKAPRIPEVQADEIGVESRPKVSPRPRPAEKQPLISTSQSQLTEKEKNDLETAKRVATRLLGESDNVFNQIIQFNNATFELKRKLIETAVEAGSEAEDLKNRIIEDIRPLSDLIVQAATAIDNVRTNKAEVDQHYDNKNVRGAKLAADKVKRANKILVGDSEQKGLLEVFQEINIKTNKGYKNQFLPLVKPFIELEIDDIYNEVNQIVDLISESYQRTRSYFEEVNKIIEQVRTKVFPDGSLEKSSQSYIINTGQPLKEIHLLAKSSYESAIVAYGQFIDTMKEPEKADELQRHLSILRKEREDFLSTKKYEANAKDIYEKVENEYVKTLRYKLIIKGDTDEWPLPTFLPQSTKRGEESYIEGHIPKPIPLEEHLLGEEPDKWHISTKHKIQHQQQQQQFANIKNTIISKIKAQKTQNIYFFYDQEHMQRFFLFVNDDSLIEKVQLSRQLAYILGYEIDEKGFVEINSFAKYKPDISGGLQSFYIYAPNLIANTIIGNQYGPLLRVINVDVNSKNKLVETIYTQEFHQKVIINQIPEIHIKILSDSGRPIEFNWGNCIATLHFRRSLF